MEQLHTMKRPNHYNVFETRKLKNPSPHLDYITITLTYNLEQAINKWIVDNCKGRYYVGKTIALQDNTLNHRLIKIGFENSKELAYFTLACPHLKYN